MNKDTLLSMPVIGALIVGLIIGGLGVSMFTQDAMIDDAAQNENVTMNDDMMTDDANDTVVDATQDIEVDAVADIGTGDGSGSVRASDQPAGDMVVVDSVTLSSDGWVTVRESLADGRLSNIIGVAIANAGTQENVEITLQRPTEAGNMYYVTLFNDNGDRFFNYVVDLQIAENGEIVRDSFIAQ